MAVNIRADVDDTEVDMAISKLKMAVTLQGQLTGTGFAGRSPKSMMKEWTDLEKTWSKMLAADPTFLARFAEMDLPSINREFRVLLGYVPGAREAMQYYFRLLRIQRGVEKAIAPTADLGPLFLTVAATTLIILREVMRAHKQWELRVRQDRAEYEDMFREGLDITHQEWVNLGVAQKGFATWGEQFTDLREEMGLLRAAIVVLGDRLDYIQDTYQGAGATSGETYSWDTEGTAPGSLTWWTRSIREWLGLSPGGGGAGAR